MALVVFGKLSAQTEASAASLSAIPAALKVGTAAGLAGAATTKLGMAGLGTTAAAILAVGAMNVNQTADTISARETKVTASQPVAVTRQSDSSIARQWFYYPLGSAGPVMLHFLAEANPSYCSWLTNQGGNFSYDDKSHTVTQVNHRFYHPDLSVMRLPTDSPELTEQLDATESHPRPVPWVSQGEVGLWVAVDRTGGDSQSPVQVDVNHTLLMDETFRNPWPVAVRRQDARDATHQRGWTFFSITGQIKGQAVRGGGRLPLVPVALEQYYPWLRLEIGSQEFSEVLSDTDAYRSDSLFTGLGRPWMGLHTIDTIRRDAATKGIGFETRRSNNENLVEIELADSQQTLVYTVNLAQDAIEKIDFFNARHQKLGELRFDYVDTLDQQSDMFIEPQEPRVHARQQTRDGLWIMQLIQN